MPYCEVSLMKKIKEILTNALYGMLRSYEGKRFIPSLIIKLVMSLVSAIITAFFANTLFSHNNTANQIFAALFFYFLITAVSNLISEIKRGGAGGRLKTALVNAVCLKPPTLWFFLAAIAVSLFLPYAFVLSLAVLLFVSAVSGENSMLLGIKNAVTKGKNPERNGKGLAAFTSGLIACGLVVCVLTNLGVPTLYGAIDGSNPKNNTSQTDRIGNGGSSKRGTVSYTDDASDSKIPKSDSGDVIVSGDTDIKDAAQTLTDKLIEYAGKDKKSFEKLFRNTEGSVIDQYYNTSYDKFREYGKSLIAIAAQDSDSVWFTALYYQIPKNYPAEKERSVYLSTIMTRGNDGWKIEWNDEARERLQSDYDAAGATYEGLEARADGYAWAKFFIPFDLYNSMIFYDGAVMCKVTEMYTDINNNVQITLYISNGTDKDIGLKNVDLTVTDGDSRLFAESFEMDRLIGKGNAAFYGLTVPSEKLSFNSWSSPKITDFKFGYEEIDQ